MNVRALLLESDYLKKKFKIDNTSNFAAFIINNTSKIDIKNKI